MFFTPSANDVLPSRTTRPVSPGFLRDCAAAGRVVPLYLDASDRWTTTCPAGSVAPPPAYAVSPETFALLVAGGTPSALGEGWTAPGGQVYRLVACETVDGARHGIAVMVGPGTPPPT